MSVMIRTRRMIFLLEADVFGNVQLFRECALARIHRVGDMHNARPAYNWRSGIGLGPKSHR